MRVRMLNQPGMIEMINQETCPVWINYSKEGFPDDLPAFSIHKGTTLPWFRLNAGHLYLCDGKCERIFSGCFELIPDRVFLGNKYAFTSDRLKRGIKRFKKMQELKRNADSDPEAGQALAKLEEDLDNWLKQAALPFIEPRVWTALIICDYMQANPWSEFMLRLRHPGPGSADHLAAGVRNASIHALGDLLTNQRPLTPEASDVLEPFYNQWVRNAPGKTLLSENVHINHHEAKSPIPYEIRRRAANTLKIALGFDWQSDDMVDLASRWYLENRNNSQYRIEWSTDPKLRYAFFRQQTE